MGTRWKIIFALAALLLSGAARAEEKTPQPCAGTEHRQFDFWVGKWKVTDREGNTAGTNHVKSILGGCVVQENWKGAAGTVGHSYNIYDARARRWHQTWVDNRGTLLELNGGLKDGNMVLEGTALSQDGTTSVHHRITWNPVSANEVTQHWEASEDGGESWKELFFGTYRK